MRIKRKIITIGGSVGMTLPTEWQEFMNIKLGDTIFLEDITTEFGIRQLIITNGDADDNTETAE